MDSERFDTLTRSLATEGISRRRLLRGLGGGGLGVVLAGLGRGHANAANTSKEEADRLREHYRALKRQHKEQAQQVKAHYKGGGLGSGCRSEPCCRPPGESCSSTFDCCGGGCQNGVCCNQSGSYCTDASACCSGVCQEDAYGWACA
jgi:hypothetical protein